MVSMNICVSANSKYARYLYVMLLSLCENNKGESIRIFVLQRDFTVEDKDSLLNLGNQFGVSIEFVKINEDEFKIFPITAHFTMETYFRFKIPDLIPTDVERLLYIDVDVIVRDSIKELFEIDLDGYYFAACSDIVAECLTPTKKMLFRRYDDGRYFNAGVLLWNLKEVRGNISIEEFMKAANELNYDLPHVDQDLLNYLFYNKTLYLDPYVYNYLVVDKLFHKDSSEERAKILHYCWYNPWQPGPKTYPYKEWWKYAKKTPFYVDFLKEQLERSEEFIFETQRDKTLYSHSETQLYEISECMYNLKGLGRIKEYSDRCNCSLIIYGAGYFGKKLYKLIEADNVLVEAVFDRSKKGVLEKADISNDLNRLLEYSNSTVVVTPMSDPEKIVNELDDLTNGSVEVLTLLDFLMEVSK